MRRGGHVALRIGSQGGRDLCDDARRYERLVALDVDHDALRRQTQQRTGFGNPVGAGGVLLAGEQGLYAMARTGLEHARAVGADHHALGAALRGALRDTHHHGHTP